MIRASRSGAYIVVMIVCLTGIGCRLRRPDTVPSRMIEPQLLEPTVRETVPAVKASNSVPIRLLDTQARGHIGRHLLHHQPNGELTEDAVWYWSSSPDRYLDTALRLELTSNPNLRLVDSSRAPSLAATLLVWDLEPQGQTRLVGAIEFQVTGIDRVVHTQVIRMNESVSPDLPGDLAAAAGRLFHRLESEGLVYAAGYYDK